MQNFQGIVFIWTQTYEKIFKSALVTFKVYKMSRIFLSLTQFRIMSPFYTLWKQREQWTKTG